MAAGNMRAQTGAPTVTLTPTPAIPATPPPTSSFNGLPGEAEVLDLSSRVTPGEVVLQPPPPPAGLKVQVMKEGVFLEWEEAPIQSGVVSYNVYRSRFPGVGYNLVNAGAVTAARFFDGGANSLEPPKNGESYFYVVAALDKGGGVSPYSDEVNAEVKGVEEPSATAVGGKKAKKKKKDEKGSDKILDIPERNLVKMSLPADSQLSIQGYKKIEYKFNHYNYYNRPGVNKEGTLIGYTKTGNGEINQELQVILDGKIGENVDVHVDFSDVNRSGGLDNSKQEISIVYHGNPDSAIQEVAFGDLMLSIPNTEFAGFNKQLFGLQGKAKVDRLKLTTLFAQTKGLTETKTFRGSYIQNDRTILDLEYHRNKYYLITKESSPPLDGTNGALPQVGGEQIWVDDGNPYNNTGSNFNGSFEKFLPGLDYTLDYATGVITFIRGGGIQVSWRVVVGYLRRDGIRVGLDPLNNVDLVSGMAVPSDGVIENAAHMLKDNTDPSAVSPLSLPNIYSLGTDKIIPPEQDPDFAFEIKTSSGVSQTGLGVSGGASTWLAKLNLDLNLLTVIKPLDPQFPERPFVNDDSVANGTALNEPYSPSSPASKFSMRLKYKTRLDFFRLDRFNIIRGSESVFVDGRRMIRDKDYLFDYASGFLNFPDPTLLRPDSDIVVTYEYAPFGSAGQSNIFGARAEYDLTDHLFLGSTFLYNGTQRPQDTPQLGGCPNSIKLLDADAKYDLSRDMIRSATSLVPGLGKFKPPLDVKFSAEIAKSSFNPDNFDAEGEKGVALVDNMEGIDDALSTTNQVQGWIVSSAPQPLFAFSAYLPVVPVAGDVPSKNRIRFEDGDILYGMQINSGHTYAATGDPNTPISVLRIPYSHLTNQRWGGVRTRISATGVDATGVKFMEAWIWNDGVDKWIGLDFGVMNENSNGLGTGAAILPGHTATGGVTTAYTGIDEELNPTNGGDMDPGLKTDYFNHVFDPSAFVPGNDQLPDYNEGRGNGVFDTKDLNGNGILNGTEAYFSYVFRTNWGTGWRLVKIPIDLAASDGVSTTTDGIPYIFHNQGINPLTPIVSTARFWMTGASTAETNGYVLLESLRLTKNRWEPAVDQEAAGLGASPDPSKFDVSSISQDRDSSYSYDQRFITVQTGQNEDTLYKTEKALVLTYNLSDNDTIPAGDPSGRPVYFATRRYAQGLDFTDYKDLMLDVNVRSGTFVPGEILFVRLENDYQNYYQYNIPLTQAQRGTWDNPVGARLDGNDHRRVRVGRPFLNRINQISLGILSPNPGVNQVRVIWVNNLRVSGAEKREGMARRFNTVTTLGKNFATVSTRYREVEGGFSQLDQTGTRFQLARQTGVDFISNSIKILKENVSIQASLGNDERLTEDRLRDNPFYYDLPEVRRRQGTGSLSYSKTLPKGAGRLTSLRLSGSDTREDSSYLPGYLLQSTVQGNSERGTSTWTMAAIYDAPRRLWKLPLGINQLNQNYTFTNDTQRFDNPSYFDFERHTRVQNYNWTNTTEILKRLVFTPGYNWSFTEAKGNTTFAGQPGRVDDYVPFEKRLSPRLGVVFRGLTGLTPSADYTGSVRSDFGSTTGSRFNSTNNLNYTVGFNPGSWVAFARKIGLTLDGGRTESATSTILDFNRKRPLTFAERWGLHPPVGVAYNSNRTVTHRANSSLQFFNRLSIRPTGSWRRELNVLAEGLNPTRLETRSLGLSTSWTKKLVRVPYARLGINSAEFQFSRNDSAQYDASLAQALDTDSSQRVYALVFPYDINKKAQGNLRLSRTRGESNQRGILSNDNNRQAQLEYTQKFLQNKVLHIPGLKFRIKFHQAMELRLILLTELIRKESDTQSVRQHSKRDRGTVEINYNALKNIRSGLSFSRESFRNQIDKTQNYNLWQGSISVEARF